MAADRFQTVETVNKWVRAGYKPEEVTQAVNDLLEKGYNISRPASINNALGVVRSKNNGASNQKKMPYEIQPTEPEPERYTIAELRKRND